MGFFSYISISCLFVEVGNVRGIVLGWYLSGYVNSKVYGFRLGFGKIVFIL